MIVLRRNIGQAVWIGNDIRIVIAETEPNIRVHLGIEAPPSVPVHRLEIYKKIQNENRAAMQGNALAWLKEIAHEKE